MAQQPSNPKKRAVVKRLSARRASRKRLLVRPADLGSTLPAVIIEKTYLNEQELAYFRQKLVDKLKQISGDIEGLEDHSIRHQRQDEAGDLSRMPIHMADVGSDAYQQDLSAGLMDANHKIVQEILAALERIERGVYGMCEGTGKPIPKARLEAFPWARYCVEYAEKLEKK